MFERAEAVNIKGCSRLDEEERREEGGEAAPAYSQWSLPKRKKDWVKGKGRKEEGKKERALLLPRKEHGLDRVLLRRLSPDDMIGSLYRLQ